MSEKKRKRELEKSERPQKKVAIGGHPDKVKVSALENDSALSPVIASTAGLSFPTSIPLNPYKNNKSRHLHLHSSSHPRLDYTADKQQDGLATNRLKHYVGVYDPSSGQLQVMEAQKLVVRSTLRPSEDELKKQQQQKTNWEKRIALGTEFGTRKAKKMISQLTDNAIARDAANETTIKQLKAANPLAAATLDSINAITADMPTMKDTQAAVDAGKPRPTPNMEATSPAEVYTLDSLIGPQILKEIAVKDWQDKAKSGEDIKTSSRFVAERLQRLVRSEDIQRLRALRYLLVLLDFNAALRVKRDGRTLPPREKLVEKVPAPKAVLEQIRRKFSEGSTVSKWHADYLMTHIAAISLVIDHYEVDTYSLAKDLRLENKKMIQYFKELGCRIGNLTEKIRIKGEISKAMAAEHKVASLKLPLEFPQVRNIPTKKRR